MPTAIRPREPVSRCVERTEKMCAAIGAKSAPANGIRHSQEGMYRSGLPDKPATDEAEVRKAHFQVEPFSSRLASCRCSTATERIFSEIVGTRASLP